VHHQRHPPADRADRRAPRCRPAGRDPKATADAFAVASRSSLAVGCDP
jgi:hypothetical protein